MLPLLSYKLYRYKKELIMKHELKNKTNGNNKSPNPNCSKLTNHCKKETKKSPSIMEITILLFGMFGVPVSYFCYWNIVAVYQWYTVHNGTTTRVSTIQLDDKPFYFSPVSISIKNIIETRLQNMHKYRFNYSWTDIDRRNDLSIEEFRDMYSGKWPVIITDCGTKWPAFKKWNKQFFIKHFGKELVAVKTMADDVAETFAMPMEVYLNHLHKGYPNQWTYLNDELFIPSRPMLEKDLGTCKEIEEDFFRMFPVEVRPWWSFLLWGTRFSRSQLHMDPFNWTGTNMVISGLKQWKLFPPGQDHLLHIISEQKYKFPINSHKYNSVVHGNRTTASLLYPSFINNAKVIEFYQYPGELLIIPTGWFHQAFNEEVTLAIAGQIMNSDNYHYVLEELFKGGDLPRGAYNYSTRTASPKQQVKDVLSRITEQTRREGKEATQFIYNQLKKLAESSRLPIPPSVLDVARPNLESNEET